MKTEINYICATFLILFSSTGFAQVKTTDIENPYWYYSFNGERIEFEPVAEEILVEFKAEAESSAKIRALSKLNENYDALWKGQFKTTKEVNWSDKDEVLLLNTNANILKTEEILKQESEILGVLPKLKNKSTGQILFLQSSKIAFSQEVSTSDSTILRFLSEQSAFLLWQQDWKKRLPEFDLTSFQIKDEKELTEHYKESISIEKIRSRNQLALMLFSPDGLRAVNTRPGATVYKKNGYYELGYGDTGALKLYNFNTNTSFRLLFSGMSGPETVGIAWLTDALLVTVGTLWDLSGEFDKTAPAVMIFDLDKMTRRTLIGNFINALDFYKTRRLGNKPLTEPRLMFLYRGKN
ncbi:hypothetical protein IIC38_20285 [candidate division KSB1 bacterium]|nr:hypothetical protein [candidate division KSB1 bacterium]